MAAHSKNEALYRGKRHYDEGGKPLGGIKVMVDDSYMVEVEGGEYKICAEAYNSKEVLNFKGKTNKEILDHIHNNFACKFEQNKANSGDFILCRLVVNDKKPKDYSGNVRQILDMMQAEQSCRVSFGSNTMKKGGIVNDSEIAERWEKKKEHIDKIANSIRSLRYNITKDLKEGSDKERLTALVIAVMDKTAERVGNNDSASDGHFGVTGFKKSHIKVIGDKVVLNYVGKSGVRHKKEFTDSVIAQNLKRAINESNCEFVFCTEDGIRIKADRVNRYLSGYGISAKDIRGYSANRWIIDRLNNIDEKDIPETEQKRARKFNKILKSVAAKVGHGSATLKKHYLLPELESEFIDKGKIIDLSDFYKKGGKANLSKTPAPKSERIYGSKVNKPESAASESSAKEIKLSNAVIEVIERKIKEHNESNPDKKISLSVAKAVVRRGMGAYSVTHRPTISGGKPNSRVAWGLARLNAFLYKAEKGKSKSGNYIQDDDLLDELEIKHKKYAKGGNVKRQVVGCIVYTPEQGFLLLQRGDSCEKNANKWHILSGGVDSSETLDEAALREISEEICWDGEVELDKLCTIDFGEYDFTYYFACINDKVICELNYENKDYEWVKSIDEMLTFDLIPELKEYMVEFNKGFKGSFAKGGSVLLAPNGKPSNLTPEQYKLVRTPEFKAWFGDWEKAYEKGKYDNVSKVIDEETKEPLVVYHGTSAIFNTFKEEEKGSRGALKEFYWSFTTNFQQAIIYALDNRRFGGFGEPRIIKAFLSIKKMPIYDNDGKFYRELEVWAGYKYIDVFQLQDFHSRGFNMGVEFEEVDGFCVKNTIEMENYKVDNKENLIGDTYYVKNSNQIKLADGTNTTFDSRNPDIRFEKGGSIKEKKDLIVLHNINPYQLREANKLGGLVTPSIAIVKESSDFTDFGTITLIGTKELIDPTKGSVKVYAGDVYSPSVPQKLYYVDEKKLNKVVYGLINKAYEYEKRYKDSEREIYSKVQSLIGDYSDFAKELNKRSYAELLEYYFDKLKIVYIVDKGIPIKIPMREKKHYLWNNAEFTLTEEQKKRFLPIWRRYRDESNEKGTSGISEQAQSDVYDLLLEVKEQMKKDIGIRYEKVPELSELTMRSIDEAFVDIVGTRYSFSGMAVHKLSDAIFGKQELDKEKFSGNINKVFTREVRKDYEEWLRNFISQFRGAAYFLKGSQKTPYTLNELVDATSNRIVGQEKNLTFGVNQAKSYGTKRLKTIEEIKKNSGVLITKEQMNEIDKENKDRFFALSEKLDYADKRNTWGKLDSLGRALADYYKGSSASAALRKNDFLTNDRYSVTLFEEFADDLIKSPVDYFEAKYQRAVSISEFKYAVVPINTEKDVIEILKNNGIKIKKYKNKEERTELVKTIAEKDKSIKFIDGGSVLLAPNGKPSNLTPEQYKLVRTPEFKAWFGDWEKLERVKRDDPAVDEVTISNLSKDVSKIVDENGEPLVVYHGTFREFTIFDISKVGNIDKGFFSKGFYFTPNESLAYEYGNNIYKCFLNIKKPIITKSRKDLAKDLDLEYNNNTYSEIAREKIISLKYDGVLQEYDLPKGVIARYPFIEIVAYYPTQIKLADGTNTTFDSSNPDIRFEKGGDINSYNFYSNCVNYPDINDLYCIVDNEFEITKSTFEKKVNSNEWEEIKTALGYTRKFPIEKDWHVRYFRSKDINGEKTYHIRHGAIEYIFKKNDSKYQFYYNKDDSFAKGGSVLLAPNGKPSNLNPEQYKLVRTPEFKAWFGDWENDPANASKVVDENGEPSICYHGTDDDFNIFDISVPAKHGRGEGEGFYFTRDRKIAKRYGKKIKPCFLNAKRQWRGFDSLNSEEKKIYLSSKSDKDAYENLKIDSIFITENHLIVFNPNQIKLADGTNTTFDSSNPDIRFEGGGSVLLAPNGKPSNLNPEQYKLVRTPEFKAWFGDWEKLERVKRDDPAVDEVTISNLSKDVSKIVDENGEPLVVYKGGHNDIYRFHTHRIGRDGKEIYGSYFSSSKVVAESYLENTIYKGEGVIYEVFLSLKNPLIVNAENRLWNVAQKNEIITKNYKGDIIDREFEYKSTDSISRQAKENNNDGIIVLNVVDSGSQKVFELGVVSNTYAAFEPNQIKIADGTNTTFDSSNPDIRFAGGGSVLLAPNGKPSNLNPEQYKLVRTPEFKAWFGDWENDPANASKVVDENGEPLPLYHGSRSEFNVFDIGKSGASNTTAKVGFWFTPIKSFAENFASTIWYGKSENVFVYSVFLSIKKPKIYETEIVSEEKKQELRLQIKELQNESLSIQKKWVEGNWDYKDRMVLDYSIRGMINDENYNYYSNLTNKSIDAIADGKLIAEINKKIDKIKSELDELTYSDSYQKYRTDIYKWEGKSADEANTGGLGMALNDPSGTITKYIQSLTENGYDGIILSKTRFDKREAGGLNDQYVALFPEQIKLADGTNTTFDIHSPDIRYEGGGKLDKAKNHVYQKWKKLVNMTASELEKFYESDEGKEAGLSPKKAKELGIHYGRESARWIIKMKNTPVSEWTETMWEWAARQNNFISRMLGNSGSLYDGKGNKTRKHTSLLIWGHNPVKGKR